MDWTIFILGISFISGFISLFVYKKLNLKKQWAIGIDINKKDQRKICESTGITLLVPVWIATLYLVLNHGFNRELIVWLFLVTGFAAIGFFDDTRNKFLNPDFCNRKNGRILSEDKIAKPLPFIVRAIPAGLIALIFALLFAPGMIWVVPVMLFIGLLASFENTFAGLNGWEIGSGFIISIFATMLVINQQFVWIGLILNGAIFALLCWNIYPAKVFPGDSGTLAIGAGIAGLLVLTQDLQLMLIGLLFFLPHIIDLLMKAITNPKDASQHKMRPYKLLADGRLAIPDYPDGKIRYDFAKLLFKIFGPLREWQVVAIIWCIVILNCLVWVIVFGKINSITSLFGF